MILRRVFLALAVMALLAGCSSQQLRDLEGVPVKDPDKAELYVNLDNYPNVVRICIDGVAFGTTTRDAQAAIFRVPEWDSWCAG